jgi:UDP-N-acetylglucosamine 4,6-dehydratase
MNGVLVTGGSGAFGRAYVAHLLAMDFGPQRIVVYSRDEHKHERMQAEVSDPDERVRYFIGDVRDRDRLQLALRGVDTVVHAAALKIVPAMEYNPTEAIKTNIVGAMNLIEAVLRAPSVLRVVALSTDKACSPVNLYGATKLCAERAFLAANAYGGQAVKFSVVRYGNVSGSTGSVIPKWRAAVRDGRPLEITDERMTRFWMTLPEAVHAVQHALDTAEGAEVFVPRLPSYRITDLAEAIVMAGTADLQRVSYPFDVTGIRPGEKLHESLISADEAPWAHDMDTHYELRPYDAPTGDGKAYSSDTNQFWLDADTLRKRLEEV